MTSTSSLFSTWGLSDDLLQSIIKLGYETPTPVQEKVIPALLADAGDVIVLAKTGTGKTAAFGIPLLEKLNAGGGIQSLILCPTRELAAQVAKNLTALGEGKKIKVTSILGGESYRRQIESLRRNPEIVVSTPGRLVDLLEQGVLTLSEVRFLILDEADEMLSFGFQDSLERIRQDISGEGVQTWLFSATMSPSVQGLSRKILRQPRNFFISGGGEAPLKLSSFAAVVFEEDKEKALKLLLQKEPDFYGIIFAQTKKQVADLEYALRPLGLGVESLHGDKPQVERHRVLDKIRSRQSRILVATDVAARGLDIQDLTHVVNFEIPWDVETYTHRIGRTARAGKEGTVWTLVRPKEAPKLRRFERALNFKFENLRIPTQKEVISQEVRKRLEDLLGQTGAVENEGSRFYDEILVSFEKDKNLELGSEVRGWLLRFLQGTGLHSKISGNEPRSFELRSDDQGRRSAGGRSVPPVGPRSYPAGVRRGPPDRRYSRDGGDDRGPRRFDRERGEGRSFGESEGRRFDRGGFKKNDDRGFRGESRGFEGGENRRPAGFRRLDREDGGRPSFPRRDDRTNDRPRFRGNDGGPSRPEGRNGGFVRRSSRGPSSWD
ncbi:MAG TPA: DEAD/DEAH box helicase [Pseudobdellovibrionaceae bacterium]|nr:DEAD/DEAH box helicase [Pseudobdellovibrionaceae bacterium]